MPRRSLPLGAPSRARVRWRGLRDELVETGVSERGAASAGAAMEGGDKRTPPADSCAARPFRRDPSRSEHVPERDVPPRRLRVRLVAALFALRLEHHVRMRPQL